MFYRVALIDNFKLGMFTRLYYDKMIDTSIARNDELFGSICEATCFFREVLEVPPIDLIETHSPYFIFTENGWKMFKEAIFIYLRGYDEAKVKMCVFEVKEQEENVVYSDEYQVAITGNVNFSNGKLIFMEE